MVWRLVTFPPVNYCLHRNFTDFCFFSSSWLDRSDRGRDWELRTRGVFWKHWVGCSVLAQCRSTIWIVRFTDHKVLYWVFLFIAMATLGSTYPQHKQPRQESQSWCRSSSTQVCVTHLLIGPKYALPNRVAVKQPWHIVMFTLPKRCFHLVKLSSWSPNLVRHILFCYYSCMCTCIVLFCYYFLCMTVCVCVCAWINTYVSVWSHSSHYSSGFFTEFGASLVVNYVSRFLIPQY